MRMEWRAVCLAILSGPAFGCICFSTPMCSDLQTLTESHAVFVGRVVEIWPLREAFAIEPLHLSFDQLRQFILQRWQGELSAEEEEFIRTSSEEGKTESRYAFMQRVRFVVEEAFAGPTISVIYTDATSCGYRFGSGQTYLVIADLDGSRYRTGACSRTAQVDSDDAVEDLKALRAWKSGTPLAPRIYGRIPSEHLRADVRVDLIRGRDEMTVRPGQDGIFSFDGLEKKQYRLRVQDGRGGGESSFDLTQSGCFEVTPLFSDGTWEILGSPVVMEPPPVPGLPDPPPLPARMQ